jgi:hypothetical protein
MNLVAAHALVVGAPGLTAGMLVSLPLGAFLSIFWVLRLRGEGRRSAALGAAVCWGVFLALITEILSVPRLITRPALSVAWLSYALVAFGYGWVLHRSVSRQDEVGIEDKQKLSVKPLGRMEWLLLFGIALLVTLVGISAILSAPNNWDAMAYHMSRVAEWMTNRDVNLYPAFYSVQLWMSPWAEYAILHLDVLYGSDRLANLVELLSMIGAVTGASLIAKQLGASVRGQLFAAVAMAALPEGVLEASGAMNTYVGGFWCVVAVYYFLRWNEQQSWDIAFAMGSAVGLAILTKGTSYVFLPCVLLACWWMGSTVARRRILARLPVFLVIVLALNGPLYVRNYRLSGSPLGFASAFGDDPQRQVRNNRVSPSIAFAGVVKNLALHISTPSGTVNQRSERIIMWTLRRLRIDPSDPDSTYRGGFHLNGFSSNEARAGNPLQLALIGLTCLLLCSRRIGDRNLRLYMLGLAASFVIFCTLIRWQPWNSRYHLPLFALGMGLVGVVLERSWNRFVLSGVACLLLVSALPFAVFNSLRPVAPWPRASIFRQSRLESYFADSHDLSMSSYVSAAKFIESGECKSIGVDSSLEDFDYPLYPLLNVGHSDRKVRYAGVRNLTLAYARFDSKPPCAVICLRCAKAPAKWAEYKDLGGRASVFGEIVVFSQNGDLPNNQTVTLPRPAQYEAILQQIDHYRDSPRAVDLATVEARIDRAGRDWPQKKNDLRARMNFLYTGGLSLWRVRDSVDPMRRKGEPIDESKIDSEQLMAALEVFQDWDQTIQAKADDLNRLIDQLYASWESQVKTVSSVNGSNSGGCRVAVEIVGSRIAYPASRVVATSTDERSVEIPDCSCLSHPLNSRVVLANKPFGKYDSEAENPAKCAGPREGDRGHI